MKKPRDRSLIPQYRFSKLKLSNTHTGGSPRCQHANTSISKQHSCVQGPLRECLRTSASGLPYYCTSICVRSFCYWCANCVDSKAKKSKKGVPFDSVGILWTTFELRKTCTRSCALPIPLPKFGEEIPGPSPNSQFWRGEALPLRGDVSCWPKKKGK